MHAGYGGNVHQSGSAQRDVERVVIIEIALFTDDHRLDKGRYGTIKQLVHAPGDPVGSFGAERRDADPASDLSDLALERSCKIDVFRIVSVRMQTVTEICRGKLEFSFDTVTASERIHLIFGGVQDAFEMRISVDLEPCVHACVPLMLPRVLQKRKRKDARLPRKLMRPGYGQIVMKRIDGKADRRGKC